MSKKLLIAVICLSVAIFMVAGGSAIAKKPYKIGAVLSITGYAGAFGSGQRDAVVALVAKINKAGGINGHPVKLYVIDDQSQPTTANIAVVKLIKDHGVHAIIGSTLTNSCMAMIPTIQKYGIPNISLGAGYKIARPTKKWIFQNPPTDEAVAPAMLSFGQKTLKAKKAAIMFASDASGQMGGKMLRQLAGKFGQKVVAVEQFGSRDRSMIPQLLKVKRSGAQILYVYGLSQPAAIIAKNVRQLGLKIPIVGSHGIPMPRFLKVGGKAANGWILFTQKATVGWKVPASDPWRARFDEFVKTVRAKYPKSVCDTFAANAYDGLMMLLNAMKKAGTDPLKIKMALESTTYKGVNGDYQYTPTNHAGFDGRAEIPVLVKNGEFVPYPKK
ncbi:MAG: ABC transporter substrate-binding protein [Proteobacteria bacterium]|nr:ABC transporter substrate-binding protein [Pseudomonadota bacterium]MBU1740700.1 ABC transporter substrate-binding protein [Pseudomonadota bacterium]